MGMFLVTEYFCEISLNCRHELEQLVHDLQSEKKCLECQIDSLDREVAHIRESCQQQRLRALDLKYELNEKTSGFDAQLMQLKDKVSIDSLVSFLIVPQQEF